MEPQTKKGLIIGGSIAAVVLIGASIGIGIAVSSGNNGLVDSSKSVEVWGYNDQVSSTAKKVNKYMGVEFQEEIGYWDSAKWEASAEGTLKKNSHYHSVNDDIEILDGVHGADAGLGYLSSTWVGGYTNNDGEGDQFTMLKLYNNGIGEDGVAPAERPDIQDEANYLDPTNDSDKVAYSEIRSEAYTINGDHFEGGTEYIYSEPMQATLNTSMKVSAGVADWLRPNVGTATALDVDETSYPDSKTFVTWLNDENLVDDFVVAYGLFNYMAYDISNIENINTMALAGSNAAGIGELEGSGGWYETTLQPTYDNLTLGSDGDQLIDAVMEQQTNSANSYAINVDGTGTNSGIMKQEISNYQADFRAASGNDGVVFKYDLNNGGSGEAWAQPKEDIAGGLVAGDANASGRTNAFIGTSSRASRDYEVEKFGYAADAASIPTDGTGDLYLSPEKSNDGQILGYTMGIDLPVFFVNKDMKFEYTVTDTSLASIDANGVSFSTGDTITVTPVGMSDEGAKAIYQDGASWTEVLDAGQILVQAVA